MLTPEGMKRFVEMYTSLFPNPQAVVDFLTLLCGPFKPKTPEDHKRLMAIRMFTSYPNNRMTLRAPVPHQNGTREIKDMLYRIMGEE